MKAIFRVDALAFAAALLDVQVSRDYVTGCYRRATCPVVAR